MTPKRKLRAGHAGGWLRDALLEALEYRWEGDGDWWNHIEIDFHYAREQRWWYMSSAKRRAQWLLGHLWHCTDIVPGHVRQEFADEAEADGSERDEWMFGTYARLARYLAEDLKRIPPASGPIQLTEEQEAELAEIKKWEKLGKEADAQIAMKNSFVQHSA